MRYTFVCRRCGPQVLDLPIARRNDLQQCTCGRIMYRDAEADLRSCSIRIPIALMSKYDSGRESALPTPEERVNPDPNRHWAPIGRKRWI